MDRRNFINIGLTASMVSLIPNKIIARETSDKFNHNTIKPNRLSEGDKIGLIAPGWMITESQLNDSITNLKQLDFEPFYTKRILGSYGYFSGSDKDRAADINEMFVNPDVKGIFCAHGGYGCTRILKLLDYNAIKKNPKVIIGYSDSTAILNSIHQETGLITFHGPISRTINNDYNFQQFNNVILNPIINYKIDNKIEDIETIANKPEFNRYTIIKGDAKGKLIGGNLTLICSMIGTKYQMDFKDKIVFIEDIGEEPYRIDRMLTQLIEIGALQKASGIVFGVFKGCEKSKKSIAPNSFALREVINERIKPLNIPSAYGLSFGHNKCHFTIPVGLDAKLDADNQTIQLLDYAVK